MATNDKSESETLLGETNQPNNNPTIMKTTDAVANGVPESDGAAGDHVTNGVVKAAKPIPVEKKMYKHFLDPMFDELQKHADANNAILDRINLQIEDERNARVKARNQEHIPTPLKGSGQTLQDVEKSMLNMIANENFEEVDSERKMYIPARLQKLDDVGKATIMSHDLAAYISTLDTPHLKRFSSKITSDCELWLTRLFRFNKGAVSYHEDERDGVVRMCKLALHQKYPKYTTEGFEALYSRPPVIYVSAAARNGLGHYICSQLGLPMSCLCTVPCNTMFGATQKIDVAVLEKLIMDDIAAAKTPVLLVAYAGTPLLGHVDNFERLQSLCKNNNIWLHVEGDNLATLVMFSVPTSISPAKSGDSMTVRLGNWLGVPGLPVATIYKKPDPALSHAIGLSTFNPQLKLNCLPLWVALQSLGHDGILERVAGACQLAQEMYEMIKDIPTVKYVTKEPEKKQADDEEFSIKALISKAINFILVFEIVSPTIVFRYSQPQEVQTEDSVAPYAVTEEEKEEGERTKLYYDALNTWLADVLQTENPNVKIDAVDIDKEGVCIRFAALESAKVLGTTKEDVVKFVDCLKSQLSILDSTVQQREGFQKIVEAQENLCIVHISSWAGLGAVQYIPDMWVETVNDLNETARKDVNNINCEIVHKLKANDTAFSLGETDEGSCCVRFGLITEDTAVQELLSLVYNVGKEVEESSKYLEHMSEIIRKSIVEANKELQKETEDKLIQEGVLRQVPLVGSFINWLSPPAKDLLKGRTFNMQSGKIESTESTYKYHMQIQEQNSPISTQTSIEEKTRLKRLSGSSVKSETQLDVNESTAQSVPGPSPPPDVIPQSENTTNKNNSPGTDTIETVKDLSELTKDLSEVTVIDQQPVEEGQEATKEMTTEDSNPSNLIDLK